MEQNQMSASHPNASKTEYVKFYGQGGEFFKIWIVNVLLTIITLTIYGAWAKVRTIKYIYGCTELAGSRLSFHGSPMAIFKGRMITLALGILYYGSSLLNPMIGVVVFILMFCFTPWIFVKSLKFRLGNTRYRNVSFSFRGKVFKLAMIFLKFYGFMIISTLLLVGFIYSTGIINASIMQNPTSLPTSKIILVAFGSILYMFSFLAYMPVFYNQLFSYIYNNIYYGGKKATINTSSMRIFKKIVWPGFLFVVLFSLGGGAIVGGLSMVFGMDLQKAVIMGLSSGAYMGFYLLGGYVAYLVIQYIWNSLTIGETNACVSNMQAKKFLNIFIGNAFLILFTLGFGYPFAKIRMKRYVLESRGFNIEDFNSFSSDAQAEQEALGEEAADALDFDFEIGF